jgi:hypothetical protein
MSYDFIPLDFIRLEPEEQRSRAVEFYETSKSSKARAASNPPRRLPLRPGGKG